VQEEKDDKEQEERGDKEQEGKEVKRDRFPNVLVPFATFVSSA